VVTYRRADILGATYIFTVVTYRRPVLCDALVRAALRDAVKTIQSRHPFTVDAWVLLPDHVDIAAGRRGLSVALGLDKTLGFVGLRQ
jgi:REP element-mobilizing transposase RayT